MNKNGPVSSLPQSCIASMFLLTSGCSGSIFDPIGPVGKAEEKILINSTAIMLAIILPTIIATLVFAWWFRAGNHRAKYLPNFEYSGAIELVVWAVPALTIMLLGGIDWVGSHDLDPAKPLKSSVQPVNVEVVALDWKWLFIYPRQGIATVNQLFIPAGAPVSFTLTSGTVWNVFFVPQMGTMIYVMPRMATRLNLEADRQGVYEGLSAHFSGDGFPGMRFKTHVIAPQQFAAWAAATRGTGAVLNVNEYRKLEGPSSYVRPLTYGGVAPGLFDAILANRAPPPLSPQTVPPAQHETPKPPLETNNVR